MTGDNRPGSRLRRIAERTFERATLERVVRPALADLEHECGEEAGVSRLVRLRAYWGLWKTLTLCLLIESATYGRPMVWGVVTRMAIIVPIVMGIVMVPPLNAVMSKPVLLTPFILTSLPQAFIFAVPIAFFFAVALDRHATSLRRLLPIVFVMSLVCTLIMLAGTLSVVPHANASYARTVAAHVKAAGLPAPVSFGPSQWTFTELLQRARSRTSERDRTAARQRLGMRLAQSTWPIMLGFLALGIAGYTRRNSLFIGVWVLIFYVAALRAAESSSLIGPSAGAVWLVNAVFTLAGLWMVWLRRAAAGGNLDPEGFVISWW